MAKNVSKLSGVLVLVVLLGACFILAPGIGASEAGAAAPDLADQQIGQIVFDGDSLTAGSEATDPYPSQVMRGFGKGIRWYNLGIGGQRIKDMLEKAPARVDRRFNGYLGRNVVVVWAGTNDLALWNHMARTVYQRLQQYCQDRRQQGFTVLVLTMLPRQDKACQPGFEEKRQAVNRRLRLSWSEFADALVDVAADTRIGVAGCEKDRRYWVKGGVHLTNEGLGIVAAQVQQALLALETPTASPGSGGN